MRQELHVSVLPAGALLDRTRKLAANERHSTVDLIEALAEVLKRELYRAECYSSMFAFCTKALLLSEGCAYDRIEAARAIQTFPLAMEMLRDGSLNLTNLRLLIPALTAANHAVVLESARRKSKDQVLGIVAALRPKPDAPSIIRRLPDPGRSQVDTSQREAAGESSLFTGQPAQQDTTPPDHHRPPVSCPARPIVPLSPARYKIQCTVDEETHSSLRRLQSLMRHQIPNGDPAAIIKKALAMLLVDVERKKFGIVTRPRRPPAAKSKGSRHVPMHVRRAVSERDDRRCTFVGPHGRCNERDHLEFHHVVPFARGGRTTVENIELRCRTHNQLEAERDFGQGFMAMRRGG